MENYREYKLENGLVVALQTTPTQTIAGNLRINFGAFHEKKGEEGLAHFLEHCLVTGGSRKYNPEESDEIIGNLGYLNAATDIGKTEYQVKMIPEDLEQWLDFISDSLFNPRFDKKRVEGERLRVLQEIRDEKSSPEYKWRILVNKAFYREHPGGIFVSGREEVIKTADIGRLRDYYSRGYSVNNMDLILVGNLPKNIENLIGKYFGKQIAGENTRVIFPQLKPLNKKTIFHISAPGLYNEENPAESSADISLSFVTVPDNHPNSFIIRIIGNILGGSNINSRFFKILGLEKGLAYNIYTSYDGSYNTGNFGISATIPSGRLDESINAISQEIKRLEEGIGEDELKRCKKSLKYSIAETFDSNLECIYLIERKLDYGLTPEFILSFFDSITPEKVREIANKYLVSGIKNEKYVLAIRDPLKNDITNRT